MNLSFETPLAGVHVNVSIGVLTVAVDDVFAVELVVVLFEGEWMAGHQVVYVHEVIDMCETALSLRMEHVAVCVKSAVAVSSISAVASNVPDRLGNRVGVDGNRLCVVVYVYAAVGHEF